MRLAFYAPLKPPDHPVPSGDRRMAQLLVQAWEQGGASGRARQPARQPPGRGRATSGGGRPPPPSSATRCWPSMPPVRPPSARRPGSPITSITRRRIGWDPTSPGRSPSPIWSPRPPSPASAPAALMPWAMTPPPRRCGRRRGSSSSTRRTGRGWSPWSPCPIAWSSCRPSSIWRNSAASPAPARRRAGRSPRAMGWTRASPGCSPSP